MSLIEEGGEEAAVGVLCGVPSMVRTKVRVFRVVRDATAEAKSTMWSSISVTVLVEGAIETRCGPRCIVDRC